jgi:hypothetical protein
MQMRMHNPQRSDDYWRKKKCDSESGKGRSADYRQTNHRNLR